MRRTLMTAAVAVAAIAALPQVAQGATLHQDGRHRILLQDTAGDANLVTVDGSHRVLIEDINVPIEIDGVPACMPVDAYSVSCAPSVRMHRRSTSATARTSPGSPPPSRSRSRAATAATASTPAVATVRHRSAGAADCSRG